MEHWDKNSNYFALDTHNLAFNLIIYQWFKKTSFFGKSIKILNI